MHLNWVTCVGAAAAVLQRVCLCVCQLQTCEMVRYPQILTLLLKRFELDYTTMSYSKSNRCVDVPLVLQAQVSLTGTFIVSLLHKAPLLIKYDFNLAENPKIHLNCHSDWFYWAHIGSLLYKKNKTSENWFSHPVIWFQEKSYELYGIVNHMGNLQGGHYTSTVLCSEDDTWYTFDDTRVEKVKCENEKISGGSDTWIIVAECSLCFSLFHNEEWKSPTWNEQGFQVCLISILFIIGYQVKVWRILRLI